MVGIKLIVILTIGFSGCAETSSRDEKMSGIIVKRLEGSSLSKKQKADLLRFQDMDDATLRRTISDTVVSLLKTSERFYAKFVGSEPGAMKRDEFLQLDGSAQKNIGEKVVPRVLDYVRGLAT